MSNEIKVAYSSGATVRAILYNPAGQVYQTTTTTYVTYVNANRANYLITMAETDSNGVYVGSIPSGSPAGFYSVEALVSPYAVANRIAGWGIDYNGTGLSTIAQSGVASINGVSTSNVTSVNANLGSTGAAVNGTNVNTLAGHDPGATLGTSTLTQTQVTGGAYSIQSSSCILGDARIANLDATVSSRATASGVWANGTRTLTSGSGLTVDANVVAWGGSGDAIQTSPDHHFPVIATASVLDVATDTEYDATANGLRANVFAMAANTVTASSLATDAVAEIANGVWTNGTRTLTSGSGLIVEANVTQWNGDDVNNLIAGRVDSRVGAFADEVITPIVFGTGAIDANAIAADAAAKIGNAASAAVTAAHGSGSYLTATSVTVSDKTGFSLAAAGLDLITATRPTGVSTIFPQMIVSLFYREYGKTVYNSNDETIKTYAANGTTVVTTQSATSSGGIDTQGEAS